MIDCENKETLFLIVAIVVIFFLLRRRNMRTYRRRPRRLHRNIYYEGLENVQNDEQDKNNEYNPKLFQKNITSESDSENYIPLPSGSQTPWDQNAKGYGETDALEPVEQGLNFNMCSKSCCFQPYPPPFGLKDDEFVKKSGKKFLSSPYTCNNGWQDSGCLCLEPKQAKFLNRRGQNRLMGDEF